MTSVRLTDDLNSYLNRNSGGGGGGTNSLSSFFNRENFASDKLNGSIGSWFGSQTNSETRYLKKEMRLGVIVIKRFVGVSSLLIFMVFSSTTSSSSSFSLSRFHRMVGFVVCLFIAAFCFGTAFLYLPFLLLKVSASYLRKKAIFFVNLVRAVRVL